MSTAFATADAGPDTGNYDIWIETLTEASARLDALQTAVTEVRHLCSSRGTSSEQVLETLERLGV